MRKLISCVLCLMMLVPMIGSADIMSVQAQTTDTDTTEIDNDYVETIDFSSFDQHIDEDDELYAMLKQGLLNANKYALTTWFDEVKNLDEDTNEYYDLKTASGNSTVNEYVYRFPAPLNLEAMKQAADFLVGRHDFRSFCSNKKFKKSTIRTIYSLNLVSNGPELRFIVRGDGFLYHMVRILVGTLLEVGMGQKSPMDLPDILSAQNREAAGYTVPACGLFLMEVTYQ